MPTTASRLEKIHSAVDNALEMAEMETGLLFQGDLLEVDLDNTKVVYSLEDVEIPTDVDDNPILTAEHIQSLLKQTPRLAIASTNSWSGTPYYTFKRSELRSLKVQTVLKFEIYGYDCYLTSEGRLEIGCQDYTLKQWARMGRKVIEVEVGPIIDPDAQEKQSLEPCCNCEHCPNRRLILNQKNRQSDPDGYDYYQALLYALPLLTSRIDELKQKDVVEMTEKLRNTLESAAP